MEWLISVTGGLFVLAALVGIWNGAKRALSMEDALYSIPSGPYSRETPEEALYRAKKVRRRAEKDAWDSEFHALTHRDGCPDCGRRSSSRRAVFF